MEFPDEGYTAYEDGPAAGSPEVVQPSAYDPGNIPETPDPETLPHYHEYTRDLTTTAATYVVGAPIETVLIRQWIVDQGYPVLSVDAEIAPDGASTTGILIIRTPVVADDIVINITKDIEESSDTASAVETYIADTATSAIPTGYTYSGIVTWSAEMYVGDDASDITLRPYAEGAAETDLVVPGTAEYQRYDTAETYSALAAGVTPDFGLRYVVDASGAETFIQNASITGTLTPDQPKGEEIPQVEWEDFAGERAEPFVETILDWESTAEGALVSPPDAYRIYALWLWLKGNGVELTQIDGAWNFNTPSAAPVDPKLRLYTRAAIPTGLAEDFLYSALNPADIETFDLLWSAAENRTFVVQHTDVPYEDTFEYSTPFVHYSDFEPTDDVRNGDVWYKTYVSDIRQFVLIMGQWVELAESPDWVPTNQNAFAAGRRAIATAFRSTAAGVEARAEDDYATAFGAQAYAVAPGTTAYGASATANNDNATAIGISAFATGLNSTATGNGAQASGDNAVAIGKTALANAPSAIAIGTDSTSSNLNTIAVGYNAEADGLQSISLGTNANVQGDFSTAIGTGSVASEQSSVAIGTLSNVAAPYSVILGANSSIPSTSQRSFALGYDADVPASRPDYGLVSANHVRVERSNSTGVTTLGLNSDDNTEKILRVTNAGLLLINGKYVTTINKRLTVNQTTASTTQQNITDLSFAVGANETYNFDCYMITYMSSGSYGIKFSPLCATASAISAMFVGTTVFSTTPVTVDHEKVTVSGTATTKIFSQTAAVNGWIRVSGSVVNGGTAGTFTLRFASTNAAATAYIEAGSWLIAYQV